MGVRPPSWHHVGQRFSSVGDTTGRLPSVRTISVPALRQLVVTAQDYVPRVRRAGPEEVESAIRRALCIQRDSVSAVERSHRLLSRVMRACIHGASSPSSSVPGASSSTGRTIEYWAHALCLPPAEELAPLRLGARAHARRGSVARGREGAVPGAGRACARRDPRARGARITDFTGKPDPAPHRAGTTSEKMWSWKPAKQILDALFAAGELVIADRVNFRRRYDLPERVPPAWCSTLRPPRKRRRSKR